MYSLQIYSLNSGGTLVHILIYKGVMVCNLVTGCALTHKVDSKTPWVYKANLIEWVRYKARDLIEFEVDKEVINSNVV